MAVEPGRNTGGKRRLYCNRTATVLHVRIIRPCVSRLRPHHVWKYCRHPICDGWD